MKVELQRLDSDFHFKAVNEDGNSMEMDASPDIGGKGKGVRPMQTLLMALGGCSAIDIILILKKQKQKINDFRISVEAGRTKDKDFSLFKDIMIHYKLSGEVDAVKAKKAIELSLSKYCSVAKTLEKSAEISFRLSLNGHVIKS